MKKLFLPLKLNSLIITLCYFSIGGVWFLFSNTLLTLFSSHQSVLPPFIISSHWLFLATTSCLLYVLLHRHNIVNSISPSSLQKQKLQKALKKFHEYSTAVAKAEDELALMQEGCRVCIEAGGHRMAWIASAEQDTNKTLKPITHYGAAGHYFDNFNATWDSSEAGKCPAGTSIRIGEPVIFQNLLTNPRFKQRRKSAKKCGFGSCVSIPLRDDFTIIGALIIFDANPNSFSGDEVKLLEDLADDISTGITHIRKSKKHALTADERLMLAAVTEQASDGIVTFDPNGIIQYANPSFIELCKVPVNDIVGVSIHDFDCSKHNPKFYQAMLTAIKSNRPKSGRFINKNQNGDEHDIDAKIAPIFNQSHQVVRYVATIRNVTKEVQLQSKLIQALKMEMLATLSGTVAHTLKKQLAVVSTHSKAGLATNEATALLRETFLSIFKTSQNSSKLIDQFTSISQNSSQPRQLTNIVAVVNKCIGKLLDNLPSTIKIKKNIAPDTEPIMANNEQVDQAIMNICANAIDAMQLTGGVLEVALVDHEITHQGSDQNLPAGNYIKLTITDTGQGINRNELEAIFDPFYTTKVAGEGRGLGLSIAHSIITNHGGTIFANSIIGAGSSFVVLLPRLAEQTVVS